MYDCERFSTDFQKCNWFSLRSKWAPTALEFGCAQVVSGGGDFVAVVCVALCECDAHGGTAARSWRSPPLGLDLWVEQKNTRAGQGRPTTGSRLMSTSTVVLRSER
jgi:hypothetical protein